MDIFIKGMEMPDRCLDCPFMISRDNDDCILQSGAANELAVTWDDLKSGCPLVEIPEKHGRLIDADDAMVTLSSALKKAIREKDDAEAFTIGAIEGFLKASPTVIEAEGQDGKDIPE